MKLFISADMEGISGVTDWQDVSPGQSSYEYCRELLTQDVNAAIEGALAAGVKEIVVNESHGPMRNIIVDQLHPKAQLLRGFHKPMLMTQGLDETFHAAFFIGYHSKAGANQAVLNHTLLTKCIQRFRLNGKEVGEATLNAHIAGAHRVSVALVTGDRQTAEEVQKDIPGVHTVAVKEGIDAYTALSYHPKVAQNMIKEKAEQAIQSLDQLSPIQPEEKYTIEIEFKATTMAAVANYIPGTHLIDGRTIRYEADHMIEAMPVITAMLLLSIQVAQGMGP